MGDGADLAAADYEFEAGIDGPLEDGEIGDRPDSNADEQELEAFAPLSKPRFALPPLSKPRFKLPPLRRPQQRFALIYSDPGWKYRQGGRGAINKRYTQSSANEVHLLDVPSISEDNAVLFQWGTWPQLPVVLASFPAWGFEYKTVAFVWIKHHKHKTCKRCGGVGWEYPDPESIANDIRVWCKACEGSGLLEGKRRINGGFWTRANTEFCLIGVRGKNHPKRVTKAIRQLIETDEEEKQLIAPCPTYPNGKVIHSAKPPEARERIVQLMGEDLTRIELYARERTPGWAVWGDDKKLGKPDVDLKVRSVL